MYRFARYWLAAFLLTAAGACTSTFPTQDDIERELERVLESVSGPWVGGGTSSDVRLEFTLTQSGTTVQGSGTFRETAALPAWPITITGSFVRPTLAIELSAFVFAGDTVTGSITGDYTSVAGIFTEIRLGGGTGGSIPVLLQEPSG